MYATNEQSDVRCHCSRCPSLPLSPPHIILNELFFYMNTSHIRVVCSWLHFVDGDSVILQHSDHAMVVSTTRKSWFDCQHELKCFSFLESRPTLGPT